MIGKEPLVFFLVLSVWSPCVAGMTLRLLDARNIPATTIACNERCRLEIKVTGMGKQGGAWPHIAGVTPNMIVGRQQRSEVSWIQGTQDAAHYFMVDVIFPKVGLLNIGPATYLDGDGQKLTSNDITCTVTDLPATKVKGREQQSYFLKWELSKEKLYVDEAISVVLSLYVTDNSVHLEGMSEINVKDAEFSLLPEVHQRSAVHNGTIYKVFSWQGILCPSRAGVLELPRVTVQFSTGAQQASPWRLMQQFFDSSLAPQQVHAPAVSMTVHAVPPTEHEIIGVGVIHAIQQRLDRHEVAAGEALVLTRRIRGMYAPTRLKNSAPPHSGVPVKMYESGIKTAGNYPELVTEQEWIFQSTAAGDLTIPEQIFWFFNTEHEAYESIVVPADSCVVRPGAVQVLNSSPVAPVLPAAAPEERIRLLPRAQCKPGISLAIFVMLMLLPLIFLILRRYLYDVWFVLGNQLKIAVYMHTAKKELRGLLRETNDQVGYSILTIMQNFIIHVIGQSRDNSLKLVVRSWLVQHGAEETLLNRWVLFWDTIEHLAFSTDVVQNKAELVQDAYFWITSIGSMARKRLR